MSGYRILRWAEIYETAYSRKLKQLSWVAIPVDLTSRGYLYLVRQPNGFALFGCWLAIVELAATMPTRGDLIGQSGRAFSAGDISDAIRADEVLVISTIKAVVSVGWMADCGDMLADSERIMADSAKHRTGQDITLEMTPTESIHFALRETDLPAMIRHVPYHLIAELYAQSLPCLSQLRDGIPKSQRRNTAARWRDHPDISEWERVFDLVRSSPFLTGNNERGWRATYCWIVKAANWDKISNGDYDMQEQQRSAGDTIADNVRRAADAQRQRDSAINDHRGLEALSGSVSHVRTTHDLA